MIILILFRVLMQQLFLTLSLSGAIKIRKNSQIPCFMHSYNLQFRILMHATVYKTLRYTFQFSFNMKYLNNKRGVYICAKVSTGAFDKPLKCTFLVSNWCYLLKIIYLI